MPGMLFTLTGADDLSGTLDGAGDHATLLARRLDDAARAGNASMYGFTRDTQGRLRDLHGRYISVAEAMALLTASTGDLTAQTHALSPAVRSSSSAMDELGKVTRLLWPAAIPAAASLVPLALGALTVAAGMAAMGAAIIPQIKALGEVAEAEKAYTDAVDKSGASSQEAAQAQIEYAAKVGKLPPATRQAAAAVSVLKDHYKEFSDSLAGTTMAPFIKGVEIVDALLPKTAGLAAAASVEADRLMTVLGGAVASPGLDRLNAKFTAFGQKTLRGVNDEIVHLLRLSASGEVGGNARAFLEWARAQGPTVASVMRSVAESVIHVLDAGSDVGVGLLQTVEAVARLVSAVPPGAIAMFLQLALALKAVKLAALGFTAARAAVVAFIAQLMAMKTAAAAAPGTLAGVSAAIGTLSRTAKLAIAGTGIGLLLIALSQLSEKSGQAPPDVDKLTSSLRQLGTTGKATGEAAKAFGTDLGGLYDKVRALTDPTTTDKVQQFLVGWTGWDSTPVKDAKANIDAVDKALANLVQGGQADLAEAALKKLTAQYGKGGRDTVEFTSKLNDYKSALADAKFEQALAAQSMGLFGAQAQSVQQKLNLQKLSADGLRQSIQALNDVQRQGLSGMIGFEAAIDATTKAAQDNAGALSMSHGQLNLNSEKARAAATALTDLAGKTDAAAASARENGSSWSAVNAVYERGRTKLIESAMQMGLTRAQAKALADQILKTPDKTARLKGDLEDLRKKLAEAKERLAKAPSSKTASIRADISDLQRKIALAKDALTNLDGYSATTWIYTNYSTPHHMAGGGPVRRAAGGPVHRFPGGGKVAGPGTSTSDSVSAMLSNGEYVINAASTRKYLGLVEAINGDRLGGGGGGARSVRVGSPQPVMPRALVVAGGGGGGGGGAGRNPAPTPPPPRAAPAAGGRGGEQQKQRRR
ncbi:hypothetical protein, partial [Streptomyces sp. NPDC050263]|uniref:hypothetical protein n=1 Tax=Streptomyces sp. NPDC050263 TaxID=3155037 RepID=UPI003418489C